nr:MAG TPA_asm: hypothetical protein [Caudoviricetes sp.]DAU30954.1 MAG TPA: hypothetical protein [Caudoviricetes sp.]
MTRIPPNLLQVTFRISTANLLFVLYAIAA